MTIIALESQVKENIKKLTGVYGDESSGDLYLSLRNLINALILMLYPEVFDEDREDISHDLSCILTQNVIKEGKRVYAWTKYLKFRIRGPVFWHFKQKSLNFLVDLGDLDIFPSTNRDPEQICMASQQIDIIVKQVTQKLKKEFPLPPNKSNIVYYLIILGIIYDLDFTKIKPNILAYRMKFFKSKISYETLGYIEKYLKMVRNFD